MYLHYINRVNDSINSIANGCIDYVYAAVASALGGKAKECLASVL